MARFGIDADTAPALRCHVIAPVRTVFHRILTTMTAFLKARKRGPAGLQHVSRVCHPRNSGWSMRPDIDLMMPLRALLAQNQLKACGMADIEAVHDAAPVAPAHALLQGVSGVSLALGIGIPAGLGVVALLAMGAGQPLLLGALALLAVAGVFLIFGLLTGFLRLSDRVAEAEAVKAVADGLDLGLQIVDTDGAVVYRNNALQRLTDARTGRHAALEELLAGTAPSAEAFFRLNRAAERGEPREEEFHVPPGTLGRRAGSWFSVSVRPIALASGGAATLWQVADITHERAREFDRVRGLEATLSFYDRLPQGLVAVNAEGRIAHLNATLAHWLGLRPEAGRVLTLLDVMSAESAALVRAAGRTSRITRLELDLLREDGRAFPAQVICRGSGPGGDIAMLVLDRTALGTESGRSGTDGRFARLMQLAPFGIATTDAKGRIVTSNAAFMRMFLTEGRTQPVTMVSDLVPEGDEEISRELHKALGRALSGRAGAAPIEVSLGPQGEFARRIYVSPLAVGSRTREGAVLYVLDATEQKALELKFAQSHKMEAVGQLAGGVAHDFNNVLTAIIGFSDLLLQTHRPTDAAYRDIMHIKSSANRAAGLVRQLLAFSRRQTLQPEVLELGEALTDLAPLVNRSLGETIELKILPGRDLWYVKADKTQFVQVIINLAVNAKDAMPDGGRLTVRTRNITERESLKVSDLGVPAGEYVLIEVEDTGVGMPPEVMAKIFEPFFTTKEVGKGTGLGLSTVYGIVKQTGGYVFADSEVGSGTTFRLYLPRHIIEHEDELPQRGEKKRESTRDLTGTGRVLLVEDEDIVRNFAMRALSRQGYEVLEAATGAEALEIMEREKGRVDIVVSDVVMPEMDGPTLLKELRRTNPGLRIIFVSGYPDDAFKKSLDENEEYAFLPKPFTLPQLAAKVKEQLGR
jgi:two-component system cell cycle sensor histidine kinase/response regulator CckA